MQKAAMKIVAFFYFFSCIMPNVCYYKDVAKSEMRTHTGCLMGGNMQFPTKRDNLVEVI